MSTETLDYGYLKNFVKQGVRGEWYEQSGALNIAVFLGALPEIEGFGGGRLFENSNTLGKYNDTIALARRNPKTGKGEIYVSGGTGEPGRYYTDKPLNPQGAAHLCWGQHPMNPFRRPKDNKLVLRGSTTRFWRDTNRDAKQSLGEPVITADIGQWYHPMGSGVVIGKWSGGCVGPRGGWKGKHWLKFLEWLKSHPSHLPIYITLWPFAEYHRYHQLWREAGTGPVRSLPTLRMGVYDLMEHGPVHELQNLLSKAGYDPGTIDGDWMGKTQRAFLVFQKNEALTVDGICGPESWNKLITLVHGG